MNPCRICLIVGIEFSGYTAEAQLFPLFWSCGSSHPGSGVFHERDDRSAQS